MSLVTIFSQMKSYIYKLEAQLSKNPESVNLNNNLFPARKISRQEPEQLTHIKQLSEELLEKERVIACHLRRTLEATMVSFPDQRTDEHRKCLRKLNALAEQEGVEIVDLESEVKTLLSPLPTVITNIVLQYFIDHPVAQGIISAGYQQAIYEENKGNSNESSAMEKVERGYAWLAREICSPARPLELKKLSNWDFVRLAKTPENLRSMDLNRYARHPISVVEIINLLWQAEQTSQRISRSETQNDLVTSVLTRTTHPLNLSVWNQKFPGPSAVSEFLEKYSHYFQCLSSKSNMNTFAQQMPGPDLASILARSFIPTNMSGDSLCLDNWSIDLQVLVDNLNDDSCFDLKMNPRFTEKLIGFMRAQDSPKMNQRLSTLIANYLIYGNLNWIAESGGKFDFSVEKLLPALIKALEKIASSEEEYYGRNNLFETLLSLQQDKNTDNVILQNILSHIANCLTAHGLVDLDSTRFQAISLKILQFMPSDLKTKVIADSMLRADVDQRRKIRVFLTANNLPIPTDDQMLASFDAYLHRNLSKLFAGEMDEEEGRLQLLFFERIKNNLQYFNEKHHKLILSYLPPGFAFPFHFFCEPRSKWQFHPGKCLPIMNARDFKKVFLKLVLSNERVLPIQHLTDLTTQSEWNSGRGDVREEVRAGEFAAL